jgi:arginine decarboxylase
LAEDLAIAPSLAATAGDAWIPADAENTYHVQAWGSGYFFVNEEGHAAVRPVWNSDLAIDLYEVVRQLKSQGVQFPALIRLQDLLQARVIRINESFRKAIRTTGYRNVYQGVFPIKVNQLREVVEEILEAGKPYKFGLECGSKAELVACLPYLETDDMPLICNGVKDGEMMRLMLAGQQRGKNILPVLERYEEFGLLYRHAREMEVATQFGVRVRLSTAGAGLWSESGGENSKFGISLTELLALVDRLRQQTRTADFKLLHFHLGSQIADLGNVRQAATEAARIYAQLHERGIPVRYLDIGGGLGVSYEAGNPDVPGSINYTLDEYTLAVIKTLKDVCDEEGVPHPIVVSESGRGITAFHSLLVFEVLSTREKDQVEHNVEGNADHLVLQELLARYQEAASGTLRSDAAATENLYNELERLREQVIDLFRRGELTLEQKAYAERLYWSGCAAVNSYSAQDGSAGRPEALDKLDPQLLDHYLCNFSVFRSMADYWAIGQRFPIMPIHRLDEKPSRRGILADLTCDSDGQVTEFVAPMGDKHFLELHPVTEDEPYYLGCFLMGAYQDIMGDMHNLFGRVAEAHIYADAEEPGNFYVEQILPGATIEEQLALVQYFPKDLERRMNDLIQQSVRAGRIRPREGVKLLEQYKQVFQNPTYLKPERASDS